MKRLSTLFKKVELQADEDLAKKIWLKIVSRNRKIIYIKITSFSLLGLFSLAGIVPAIVHLAEDFSNSGFYEYLSVAFSSNGNLASYWKELSFSLVESLPMLGVINVLLLVFILFISIKFVAKQIIKNQLVLSF